MSHTGHFELWNFNLNFTILFNLLRLQFSLNFEILITLNFEILILAKKNFEILIWTWRRRRSAPKACCTEGAVPAEGR